MRGGGGAGGAIQGRVFGEKMVRGRVYRKLGSLRVLQSGVGKRLIKNPVHFGSRMGPDWSRGRGETMNDEG